MKITQSHLALWEASQRRPSWAAPLIAKTAKQAKMYSHVALIDDCINAQTPQRLDTDIASLLELCRSYRKRGVLRTELRRLVCNPGTLINPEKRSLWASRILRRLDR